MSQNIWYYTWAVLLVLGNLGALAATVTALPGNWLIVGLTALFAWLIHDAAGGGVSWYTVGILLALATLGELVEFIAGAAGAARSGGSRRGMLLAVVGTLFGSMLGVTAGTIIVPIPVLGSVISAIGGGALGAFVGAYIGESWKGRSDDQRLAVSKAAFVGRLLGTVGKLWVGAVMVVVAAADAFFF